MLRFILATSLAILLFTACGNDRMSDAEAMGFDPAGTSQPAPETVPNSTPEADGSIQISDLTQVPPSLVDCPCQFRMDKADDIAEAFFAFAKNGNLGYIGIGGADVEVSRSASLSPANAAYESYLHENAQVKIQTSLTREADAASGNGGMYSGKVKITNKADDSQVSFNVIGECSC